MAYNIRSLVAGYRLPGQPISLDEMKTFLWGAATRLRGQIDAAGYKEYIFPLLFFKRISDVYDEQYKGFLMEGGAEYAGMQAEELAITEADIDKMIDEQGFDSISRDDAKRLLGPVFDGMRQQNAALGQALSAQYSNSVKQYKELTKKRDTEHYNRFADKIRRKFPDLAQLQRTQAYVDVMRAPVAEGSDVTVGDLVAKEYQKRNYKYINNVLKQVRDRINSVPDISASAVIGGNAPSQGSGSMEAKPLSDSEMSDLRFKLQNRQISRKEFSDALKRHREALRGNAE